VQRGSRFPKKILYCSPFFLKKKSFVAHEKKLRRLRLSQLLQLGGHCNEKSIIRWPSDREPSDGHQRKTPIPPDGNFRIFPPASHFKLFPSDGPLSIPIRYLFAMTHLMQIKKFPLDGLFLIPLQCLFAMTHLM